MKRIVLSVAVVLFSVSLKAQITSPVIRANFGVDADLRSNFFDDFLQAGNDDWFNNGSPGPGIFIIDTTGAAFINQLYISNPASRMSPFFRNMRYPQFTVINNAMLIDGIFIRDHHGDDSTVFASGSNKNGMSPEDWQCPVSQGIPDKNDILDMMMHVRRAGPNSTDSLWMFAGLSLDNTTGNRYIDFEMYQTDIYYDRASLSFKGFGPTAGHTKWEFDAAGNVLKAGDIIFTAEYSSSSLSALEARIWVSETDRLINPVAFSWGTSFDGGTPGATYGYANILPKTAGSFYTGMQCSNNTWGGPFRIVLQDNSLQTNYSARQFMEFSVNLSKLGLDPLVNMGDPCLMPFRRILVKTRASTSFTAELKDFVGPFSFFRAPALGISSDLPYMCSESDIATISVDEPLMTSLYTWTTSDGNILGTTTGPEIQVDEAGTYIVSQELMDSCGSTYARDTITLVQNTGCIVLHTELLSFTGAFRDGLIDLDWTVMNNRDALYFQVERSTDNKGFVPINKQFSIPEVNSASYSFTDNSSGINSPVLLYRLKIVERNGHVIYSKTIAVAISRHLVQGMKVLPNPVKSNYSLLITSLREQTAEITVMDMAGNVIESLQRTVSKGSSVIPFTNPGSRPGGVYFIRMKIGSDVFTEKMIYMK
jgi:hypothetical protein